MKGSAVAKRYSNALWLSAKDSVEAEAWFKVLETFQGVMKSSSDFSKLLLSPVFNEEKKEAVLVEVLAKISAPKTVTEFLKKTLQAGRMSALNEVVSEFRSKLLASQGTAEILVESALPLTGEQKKDVEGTFGRMLGKKILIAEKHVPGLLSGMSVSYAGKTYDGSLRTQLKNLEKHLLKEDLGTHATA